MAVNLVTVTTINRTVLYRGQPTTSNTTLYTVPGSTDAKIASITICNTTTTAATLTLSVVQSGGTAGVTNQIMAAYSVPASATVIIDSSVYMNTGDFVAGLQGTTSALTVTISGETYA
jgi:hypothetical protein